MRKGLALLTMLGTLASAPPSWANPADAEEVGRLLVLDIKASRRERGAAKALTARLTTGLDERLEVVTVYSAADLARLADLEVEKQKLGCDVDQASCLSEIADAFGARFVSYGNIGTIGRGRFLEVTIVDVRDARPVDRVFLRGEDAGVLLEQLEGELDEVAAAVRDYLGLTAPRRAPEETQPKERRKPASKRVALAPDIRSSEHARRRREVQALEERYAGHVGAATAIFATGGVVTGACLSICGVGAILGAASPSTEPLSRTSGAGTELMVCGGVGGGLSLLTTLGFGLWQASLASEAGEQLETARKRVRRVGSGPSAMPY